MTENSKSEKLLEALGDIPDEMLERAAPEEAVRRRPLRIIRAAAAAVAVVAAAACALSLHGSQSLTSAPDTSISTLESQPVLSDMPEPFSLSQNSGGDENWVFYQPCNRVLDNIPGSIMQLRDSSAVEEWISSISWTDLKNSCSIKDYHNLYSFITDFGITRQEAETALAYYLESDDDQLRITHGELDVILSGNISEITRIFASEYSIVCGDKIYSPCWVYYHSAGEYRSAGITPEAILSKVPLYSNIYFTDQARTAFGEKLSEFTGTEVVFPQEKQETSEPEIASDTASDLPAADYDDFIETDITLDAPR